MKSTNGMLKLIQPLRLTLVLTLLSATLAHNTNSTINSSADHLNLDSAALNQSAIQANSSLPQKSLSDVHPIDISQVNCFSDDELHQHINSFVHTNTLEAYYESCIKDCDTQRSQSLSAGLDDDLQCSCKSVLKGKGYKKSDLKGKGQDFLVPIKPRYARDANKVITVRPEPNHVSKSDFEKAAVKGVPGKEIPVLKTRPVNKVATIIRVNADYFVPISEDKAQTIKVEDVEYVPVNQAPIDINIDNAIIPKYYGKINTFKIGEENYIPLKIIPIVYRPAFKLQPISPVASVNKVNPVISKKVVDKKSSVKIVIRVNGHHYVPIKNNSVKPIVVQGVTYIPVRTAPESAHKGSVIVPKTSGHIETFKVGKITYIPLNVIPKVHRAVFKPVKKVAAKKSSVNTVIRINGEHYVPIKNKTVKPIVVEGVTYIPVHTAPESANKSSAIVPKKIGHIDTFKVGKITYIPLNIIPKVYRQGFKPVKKVTSPVIQINGKFYIPVKKNAKPIIVEGKTYIPVHIAPSHVNTSSSIHPKTDEQVSTFKIGNETYIPIDVVPKTFQSVFKNKNASEIATPAKVSRQIPKTLPAANQPKIVIKINGGHYIPITHKNVKPIVVEGISYIPVQKAPESVNKSAAIASNKNGTINIFKIGNITYIPLNAVPKVFQSIFKNKVKPARKEISHPAIKIGDINYIPVTNKSSAKPIVEKGVTYIPVNRAPAGKVFKNPNLPTSTVAPITRKGQTYIPVSQIPKILLPIYKKTAPVLKIGDQHFVPIKNQTVHPVSIDGVKYIPVKLANASHHDFGSAISPRTSGNIKTFKIGNFTYIPLSVVPKVYRQIFKTVKEPSPPSKVIMINGKSYSPITQITVKPITVEGIQYIPVKHVNHTQNKNNTITPEVEGKLNTFKIGNKTYIPLSAIPAKHRSYFKRVVTPAKKPKVITPILKINDLLVVPITSKTVKKIVVGEVTYIPVKLAGKSLNTNHSIVPDVDGKINTIKIGNQLYIPLSVVPKVYAPIFRNRIVPVNNQTVAKTVIQINGQHFVPITDKKHKQVLLGGITYVPVHSASASHDITTPIIANKKVNTFQIGKITYVPLVVIPTVYRAVFNYKVTPIKKSSTPVIKINGAHFVPIRGQHVKPITVGGITYIPVHPAPKHVDTSKAIINENEGSINTFKIGSKTYIPISVIPKVHRAIFKNKVRPANITRKITTVISINGNHFVPITNKTVKPIVLDGATYLPVHKAPYYLNVKKPISPKVEGHINTFAFGNITYIPIHVIPKTYLPIFENKPVKATPKSVNKYVISINGKTYKPITNSTSKHLVIDSKVYIPVRREMNSVNDKRVITPNHEDGQINTFKIGSKTYIPLSVVPKVFKAVFAYKVTLPAKKGPKQPPMIKINDLHFIPVADKSIKPVVVDSKIFVPVRVAPDHFNLSKSIEPKKKGEIQTFKIGEYTYIPLAVIPKKHHSNFKQAKPETKSAPILTVIKVNNVHYTPIKNGNVKPIKIDGKFFVPVNKAPESLDIKNPLKPTKSGKVNTLKIAGQTYIPLAVLPKVYRPIFLNKPVKVTPASVKNHVISINGKTFKPITDSVHNQIVVRGKVYVPVHHIETENIGTKNVITPNQAKKVNTFKVGNQTYIPLEHIPKSYRPIFNYKVEQVKVVRSSIGITINGQNYIPIANKTVYPTIINGKHYIPVHTAPDNVVIQKTIQTSDDKKINTIKIGKLTYIPLSVIPNHHRAVFKNRAVPNLKTSPKVVIRVNNQQYHPITDKKVKPIIIDDRVYIPVYKPVKALDVSSPLTPKKQGKISTFKIGNYHYIPLDVIPKAYKPIFVNKPVKVNNQTLHSSIIKVNGGHYIPYTGKASKPVVIGGIKYIPVRVATKAHNISTAISTTFDGKVNTFKFGNKTYIPLAVIPKAYKAVFTHKITPLVKPVPRIVLKVNDSHYVPLLNSKVKPITKNNVTYIPVREIIDKKSIKNPIASKQKGDVIVFKIGNCSYIPLNVVPKVYAPIFKNRPVAATKENANNHVIKINGKTFRPILNESHKPVVINGVNYIPVHHIEQNKVGNKSVIAPNQVKKINTINIGNHTYIPISVIPKVYRAVFTYKVLPLKPATPKPITRVINVNNAFYVPITNKAVKPIVVEGVKYVPVNIVSENVVIKKPIAAKSKGTVNTFKLGNHTYIPLSVIPKVYKPIFLNKPVKATKKTVSKTVITVNGKTFVPITDKFQKVVVVKGIKYIPVKQVASNSIKGNSTIHTNGQQINTFKIGTKTYIPLVVVPKAYRAVFTYKVKQTKKVSSANKIVIRDNGECFSPITNKEVVTPVIIDDVVYIPVRNTPSCIEVKSSIKAKNAGAKVNIIKIGKQSYIPLKVIPKAYKAIFVNKPVPVTHDSVRTTVIKINGNLYKPIANETHKQVNIGGVVYIPVHQSKSNDTIKRKIVINQDGQVHTFKIGSKTYIPLNVIPKVYASVFQSKVKKVEKKPTVFKINGQNYIPASPKNAKPVQIEGKTYVPVKVAPIQIDTSSPVNPKVEGQIQTFKIGNQTYVPLRVIPKAHRAVFRTNKKTKRTAPITTVIKINGEHFIPITITKVVPIVENGITYIPVKRAPLSLEITKSISPNEKEGLINTFKIGKYVYIPLDVIPKAYKPIFRNKPVKVNKESVSTTAIKINDLHYKPITTGRHKTVTIDEVKYIPVDLDNNVSDKNVLVPNSEGKVNTFKIGKIHYIPASSIPKAYKAVFKFKVQSTKSKVPAPKVIQINDSYYIPAKNTKSIVIQGKHYIPVIVAPLKVDISNPIQPTKNETIKTIKVGDITYVPLKVIPKVYRAAFKPTIKKTDLIVIKINGKIFKPIANQNIKPIVKDEVTYLPVQQVKNTKEIKNTIKHKSNGPVHTFKVGIYTYIPVSVIPQVYAPIFRNKKVSVTKENAEKHAIKINGKTYKPITHGTHRQIVINGTSYIPVHKVKSSAGKSVISVNSPKKVNTFTVGEITYIPAHVVPKVYKPLFKFKVLPYKKPVVPTTTIRINGEHYIPITNQTVKPVVIKGIKYIPVHSAPDTLEIHHPIIPKTNNKTYTFNIGGKTYVPLSVIPKVFESVFKNQKVAVNRNSLSKTVIQINGKHYLPINGKKLQSVLIEGRVYIPVRVAPKRGDLHRPIITNKEGQISTFKLANVTYIPLDVVPKVYRAVFKHKIASSKSPIAIKTTVKPAGNYIPVKAVTHPIIQINGQHYIPISKKSNPIVFDGKTYIPVQRATERQIRRNAPILPLEEGPINTIVRGNTTYIPIAVIPKAFRSIFKAKVVTKSKITKPKTIKPNNPTHVIVINGKNYVPINNQTQKVFKFEGATYIPVYSAPSNSSKLIPVKTTISGPVNTFKLGNITYIPFKAIPKSVISIFKPVKKQVVSPNPVIKINGNHYVPVKAANLKPITIDGVTFIPVRRASEKQINSSTHISPKKQGKIDTFNVGNVTYVPLNVIPKIYKPLFKKSKKAAKLNNATHVIHINDQHYVPIRNKTVKPIVIDGVKYIPVYTVPAHKIDKLKSIAPTKSGKINTIKVGSITYIPASVIPKAFRKLFVPAKKPLSKNPVIAINGAHYVPLKDKSIEPIKIEDTTYIPVKKADPENVSKSRIIVPKVHGKVETIKIGNVIYIPLSVIPKVYRPVFRNKVVVKKVANNATHVIIVNGKNYVPVNNQTLRPVVIGGIKYLPVYKAPAHKLDSLLPISAKTSQPVDTFKIKNVTYIPASIIPRAFQPLFRTKVPVKQISDIIAPVFKNTTLPQLLINGEYFQPITWRAVKYFDVDGNRYLPSSKVAPDKVDRSAVIQTPLKGKVLVINRGNISYIPVASIPKNYIPIYRNIPTPVVIVSNTPYVPVQKENVETTVVGNVKYIPVQPVPVELENKPVFPKAFKVDQDSTFKIKNKLYIEVKKIPTSLQPYFKNSSFVPGSKPESYKPFGEDNDFCPCASKISWKKRFSCPSTLKTLSESSCQEVEQKQAKVAQIEVPKESKKISSNSSYVQGKLFRSAHKTNENVKLI